MRSTTLAWMFALAMIPATCATNDLVEGNPDSSIKVTIYEDMQCGYCQAFRTMLDDKLLPRYGSKVAFIHRDFPLGRHEWARSAAMAARWVFEHSPRLSVVFRRELLAEQEHITPAGLRSWVSDFAARNKLSDTGIVAALTDQRLAAAVDQDIQLAAARGIKKLPTVFAAGKVFSETIVYDDVAKALDDALTR